jgi:hypothetical protein
VQLLRLICAKNPILGRCGKTKSALNTSQHCQEPLGVHALHLAELTCYMTVKWRLARSDDPELRGFSAVSRVAANWADPESAGRSDVFQLGFIHPEVVSPRSWSTVCVTS